MDDRIVFVLRHGLNASETTLVFGNHQPCRCIVVLQVSCIALDDETWISRALGPAGEIPLTTVANKKWYGRNSIFVTSICCLSLLRKANRH